MRRLILLGPQPNYETLKQAIDRLNVDGAVALITAGWEEDEDQDRAVHDALPVHAINLNLFARSERLFAEDQVLIQRLQNRQDELRCLRDVYRTRLESGLHAARTLLRRNGDQPIDLEPERESTIDQLRQIDRQYFVRTSQICDRFEQELQTAQRHSVGAHRHELAHQLNEVQAVIISGGHAAIILNRLRIFGILDLVPDLPIIAWSGGAMALADQIVFFHDSPPQGPGNPEVLRAGMGVFQQILPLPDARHRLNLSDRTRVALFARRFETYACMVFDEQTLLDRENGQWSNVSSSVQLSADGSLREFAP